MLKLLSISGHIWAFLSIFEYCWALLSIAWMLGWNTWLRCLVEIAGRLRTRVSRVLLFFSYWPGTEKKKYSQDYNTKLNKTRETRVLSRPAICWIHYVQIAMSISAEHLSRASQPSISAILKNAQQCSTVLNNALKHSDMLINAQQCSSDMFSYAQ